MRYKVTVVEVDDGETNPGNLIVRYEQIVDQLDMQAVINAVNTPPGKLRVWGGERQRALRSDAGKPRSRKEEAGE